MSRTLWFYLQAGDNERGVGEVMWYGPQCRRTVCPETKMLDDYLSFYLGTPPSLAWGRMRQRVETWQGGVHLDGDLR